MSENVVHKLFMESYHDFPICNHIQGIEPENLGYKPGVMVDGTPFEAEVYEYGEGSGRQRELAVIMSDGNINSDDARMFLEDMEEEEYEFDYAELEDDDDLDWGYVVHCKPVEKEKSNIEGIHYDVEMQDMCVLPIGMVLRGQEKDFTILQYYYEYLIEMGLIQPTGDICSASVFYYTDCNGQDLVQIRTGLIIDGEQMAKCSMNFLDFPVNAMRKKAEKKASAKFKVVK